MGNSHGAKHQKFSFLLPAGLSLAALIIFAPGIIGWIETAILIGDLKTASQKDFVNYWFAARLFVEGRLDTIFVPSAYFTALQAHFGDGLEIRIWSYPPHYLLLMLPLAAFDYVTAAIIFQLTGLAFFALAVFLAARNTGLDRQLPMLLLLLVPFILMQLNALQNGFWIGGLMLMGLVFARNRPILAGLCFALLTVKPQLGILVPFLLLAQKNWTAMFATIAAFIVLLAATAAIFGTASFMLYWTETVPYQARVMHDWFGGFLMMMPTIFASMRVLGAESDTAQWVHLGSAIALFVPIAWAVWRIKAPLEQLCVLVAGTFALTPYAFNYDMGAFAALAALLAIRAPMGSVHRLIFTFGACLPAVVQPLGNINYPLTPLLLLALIICICLPQLRSSQAFHRSVHVKGPLT